MVPDIKQLLINLIAGLENLPESAQERLISKLEKATVIPNTRDSKDETYFFLWLITAKYPKIISTQMGEEIKAYSQEIEEPKPKSEPHHDITTK